MDAHGNQVAPAAKPAVIVTQPIIGSPKGVKVQWTSGSMDCCQDMTSCALGTFCTPYLYCCLASRMGENCCVATCQGGPWALRSVFRERHNIQGDMCNDYLMASCC